MIYLEIGELDFIMVELIVEVGCVVLVVGYICYIVVCGLLVLCEVIVKFYGECYGVDFDL